jgi:hypothetical protein
MWRAAGDKAAGSGRRGFAWCSEINSHEIISESGFPVRRAEAVFWCLVVFERGLAVL